MKTKNTEKCTKEEFITSRLKLAQSLLEEADLLLRHIKVDRKSKKWWLHPMHEREALVSYLLLTCFDLLGQQEDYLSFNDWLRSKKKKHIEERNDAFKNIPEKSSQAEAALKLSNHYNELYGVKKSFYNGIKNLPADAKNQLLSSVRVSRSPKYGSKPNTTFPSYPFEENEETERIKLKFIYDKRNNFTHKLEQFQKNSIASIENRSCWWAEIEDSKLRYLTASHQSVTRLEKGGAVIKSISGWPFVLFKVLYKSIGVDFDITDIDVRFYVTLINRNTPKTRGTLNEVKHKKLKDYISLEKEFWEIFKLKSLISKTSM